MTSEPSVRVGVALCMGLVLSGTWRAQAQPPPEVEVEAQAEVEAAPEGESPDVAPDVEVAPEPPEDPQQVEARERFRQGLMLARSGNCAGALAELNASLAIVERPNTLFNIARCHEELFRYDLAVASYERYLAIAPPDAEDRGAVEATMRSLRGLLGTIVIASNVPAEVWIGDRVVGAAPGEVLVPGGRHAVELRAEGYISARREVEVAGRGRASVSIDLESAEVNVTNVTNVEENVNITEDGGAPPAVFYSALGLTVAAGIVGVAFAGRAMASGNRTEGLDPLDRAGIEAGNAETSDSQLLADIFFGATGALAITTIVLYFLTDFDGETDPDAHRDGERDSDRDVEVTPSAWLNSGGGGLSLQGQF